MRTTVTMERDVAARLAQLARRRRVPMKGLINEVLRAGLDQVERPAAARQPFRTAGFDLGSSRVGTLDDVEGVLARVEGESHR
jgi:predicted transcriptional regulator